MIRILETDAESGQICTDLERPTRIGPITVTAPRGVLTATGERAILPRLTTALIEVSGLAGNGDGFVANRSRAPFSTEMIIMLEEGALPEEVDKVMVDFGYPIGPFAVADLSGLDIGYDTRKRRAEQNPNYRKMPIADRIVEAGRLGQKNGKGWYRYDPGDRTPHPDPEVTRIIKDTAAEMGIPQRELSDDEILKRLLFASVNEACKLLEEGKALRASDVDVMWLHGFGFPRYRGGLMYWADGIGVREVYNQIAAWHQRHGERWAPSPQCRRRRWRARPSARLPTWR